MKIDALSQEPDVDTHECVGRNARDVRAKSHSEALYNAARSSLVDGYSRPLARKPYPHFIESGEGCWVTDVDGNRRIDYSNNFTTLIHGHSHPRIVSAIQKQAELSTCSTMPSALESQLADMIAERIPGIEQVRFWNTGTEAVMLSIKMARAYTGRTRIAKIEGGYHGQYDLIEASFQPSPDEWGDSKRPNTVARNRGTPASLLEQLLVLPCNDVEATRNLLAENADDLAAVVICPIQVQTGYGKPSTEYLQMLREETRRHGILLIFDEIVAYRNGYTGTQGQLRIYPDITTLGKGIGGGLPIGALGASREIMSLFKTGGDGHRVFHSGTFTANPMTMAAGCVSLDMLDQEAFDRLDELSDMLCDGIDGAMRRRGVTGRMVKYGVGMCKLMLGDAKIENWRDLYAYFKSGATDRIGSLQAALLDEGVMTSRLSFVLSTPMTQRDIEFTIEATDKALSNQPSAA